MLPGLSKLLIILTILSLLLIENSQGFSLIGLGLGLRTIPSPSSTPTTTTTYPPRITRQITTRSKSSPKTNDYHEEHDSYIENLTSMLHHSTTQLKNCSSGSAIDDLKSHHLLANVLPVIKSEIERSQADNHKDLRETNSRYYEILNNYDSKGYESMLKEVFLEQGHNSISCIHPINSRLRQQLSIAKLKENIAIKEEELKGKGEGFGEIVIKDSEIDDGIVKSFTDVSQSFAGVRFGGGKTTTAREEQEEQQQQWTKENFVLKNPFKKIQHALGKAAVSTTSTTTTPTIQTSIHIIPNPQQVAIFGNSGYATVLEEVTKTITKTSPSNPAKKEVLHKHTEYFITR